MGAEREPAASYAPDAHYDRVTRAWSLLLGEELHYGVFTGPDDPLAEATAHLTDEMIAAADLVPGLAVLDVGCGTGAPACRLVREYDVLVRGITTSTEGVAAATARAAALGLGDRACFTSGDGMDNGFDDASFDRAWVLEASHLMRHRDRLVDECARVLRPGGRLVLCDVVLRRPLDLPEVRRLREPLTLLRDVFGDARMEPLEEYRRLCTAAGLEVAVERDLTAATRPTFDRWAQNAERHRDEVDALLGREERERFVRSCDVLRAFWDDGTLGYGLLAADRPR